MKAVERVAAYYYDNELGNYCYGGGNPMRPHRARMVYSLLDSYGLLNQVTMFRPRARTFEEITEFHADEYVAFLKNVTPNHVDENINQLRRFNMGLAGEADCPVFEGLYEYCQIYSGGSVGGAAMINEGVVDLIFNWSGGMHHAKRAEASGFCYINDIVLAILELLKQHARVLYVDIDIHHGDGVEEAFYLSDRVMTVSFHKYGEFFPGTGHLDDIGCGAGKNYCVNVPLRDGMDDESYRSVYEPIMAKVMEVFQPGAIVMCCGADSLSGDRLGCFNLSVEGHSNCLEFLKKFNVPMMVLGGGGYTMRNVARCWCYETGRMMGVDLPDNIPETALAEYNHYLDTQRLRIATSNMKNANTRDYLDEITQNVIAHLSQLPPVPSAPLHHAPAPLSRSAADAGEEEMEERGGGRLHRELRRERPGDLSDDEDDPDRPAGVGCQRDFALAPDGTASQDEDGNDNNGNGNSNGNGNEDGVALKKERMEEDHVGSADAEASDRLIAHSDYAAASLETSAALSRSGGASNGTAVAVAVAVKESASQEAPEPQVY